MRHLPPADAEVDRAWLGESEMGRRLLELDCDETPLGPLDDWPVRQPGAPV